MRVAFERTAHQVSFSPCQMRLTKRVLMRVLVACERSQRVCAAFRALGHEAYSCDVEPTHGDPEWHIQGDCLPVVQQPDWDLIVAFPPCTHLASGAQYWPQKAEVQCEARRLSGDSRRPCPRVAIENPVGVLSSRWRKPDQISKLLLVPTPLPPFRNARAASHRIATSSLAVQPFHQATRSQRRRLWLRPSALQLTNEVHPPLIGAPVRTAASRGATARVG